MRIVALLSLPLMTMIGVPALAMEYSPAPALLAGSHNIKPRLIAAKPAGRARANIVRRRNANHVRTTGEPAGLIITDFKPDSGRAFAGQTYLPHFTENLAYETEDDYRKRMWRLKKVGPGSVMASVKYRF